MEYYLKCKKVDTAIKRAKKILIKRADANGIYENFGQEEVNAIRDKFTNYGDYSAENRKNASKVFNFEWWCMNYTT